MTRDVRRGRDSDDSRGRGTRTAREEDPDGDRRRARLTADGQERLKQGAAREEADDGFRRTREAAEGTKRARVESPAVPRRAREEGSRFSASHPHGSFPHAFAGLYFLSTLIRTRALKGFASPHHISDPYHSHAYLQD